MCINCNCLNLNQTIILMILWRKRILFTLLLWKGLGTSKSVLLLSRLHLASNNFFQCETNSYENVFDASIPHLKCMLFLFSAKCKRFSFFIHLKLLPKSKGYLAELEPPFSLWKWIVQYQFCLFYGKIGLLLFSPLHLFCRFQSYTRSKLHVQLDWN